MYIRYINDIKNNINIIYVINLCNDTNYSIKLLKL